MACAVYVLEKSRRRWSNTAIYQLLVASPPDTLTHDHLDARPLYDMSSSTLQAVRATVPPTMRSEEPRQLQTPPVPAEGTVGLELASVTVAVATAKIEATGLQTETAGRHELEMSLRTSPTEGIRGPTCYHEGSSEGGGGCRISKESHLGRAF